MDRCDGATLALAVLPVAATIVGFWISHWLESQRQETQRAFDREQRSRETRRALLERLQQALAGVRDGAEIAAFRFFVDRERSVDAAKAALNEPWFRDWQEAVRQVSILAAQLNDEHLKTAAKDVNLSYEHMVGIESATNQRPLDEARESITTAYERANDHAGRLIQEIDAFAAAPARGKP
jgi:hypothetical protein